MPKPERILLQEKAWPKHATLANGVKCGEEAASVLKTSSMFEAIRGWEPYISLSGEVMKGMYPSEAPGSDPDEIFRVVSVNVINPEERGTGGGPFAGKRILGLMTNKVLPDIVRLVVDVGDDPQQPGQLECEAVVLATRDLSTELIEQLQFMGKLPDNFRKRMP